MPEGGGDGDGPDIPDNTDPVARLKAKVYFVECDGGPVPGTGEAPVGCRVHLDVTPKDSSGRPTQAKGTPQWTYSDTAPSTSRATAPTTRCSP